jgi:hypothetical protein
MTAEELAEEWIAWALRSYNAILPPPVARLLAATGVRP